MKTKLFRKIISVALFACFGVAAITIATIKLNSGDNDVLTTEENGNSTHKSDQTEIEQVDLDMGNDSETATSEEKNEIISFFVEDINDLESGNYKCSFENDIEVNCVIDIIEIDEQSNHSNVSELKKSLSNKKQNTSSESEKTNYIYKATLKNFEKHKTKIFETTNNFELIWIDGEKQQTLDILFTMLDNKVYENFKTEYLIIKTTDENQLGSVVNKTFECKLDGISKQECYIYDFDTNQNTNDELSNLVFQQNKYFSDEIVANKYYLIGFDDKLITTKTNKITIKIDNEETEHDYEVTSSAVIYEYGNNNEHLFILK